MKIFLFVILASSVAAFADPVVVSTGEPSQVTCPEGAACDPSSIMMRSNVQTVVCELSDDQLSVSCSTGVYRKSPSTIESDRIVEKDHNSHHSHKETCVLRIVDNI